jgi:hypothetical protein
MTFGNRVRMGGYIAKNSLLFAKNNPRVLFYPLAFLSVFCLPVIVLLWEFFVNNNYMIMVEKRIVESNFSYNNMGFVASAGTWQFAQQPSMMTLALLFTAFVGVMAVSMLLMFGMMRFAQAIYNNSSIGFFESIKTPWKQIRTFLVIVLIIMALSMFFAIIPIIGALMQMVISSLWVFVVPVVLFTETRAWAAVKYSAQLLRKTWIEYAVAIAILTLLVVVFAPLTIIPIVLKSWTIAVLLAPVVVIWVGYVMPSFSVCMVALYNYATSDGQDPFAKLSK